MVLPAMTGHAGPIPKSPSLENRARNEFATDRAKKMPGAKPGSARMRPAVLFEIQHLHSRRADSAAHLVAVTK